MAPRRKRCAGCGVLYPPGELQRVAGREALCPDCLLAEGVALGNEIASRESGVENRDPSEEAPEPLPMPDEEERFAGLVEIAVPGWPLRKGRLSASALATFLRCPEQFRRHYVKGERTASGGKAIAGTAAHATVEAALRHLIAGRGAATLGQIQMTYDATFDAAVSRASRDGIEWGKSNKVPLDADSARGLGQTAMLAYYGSPSYDRLCDAIDVEHTFAMMVPGVPVPICGLMDVVGPRATVDLKFGDKCVSAIDPGWRVQARVYGLAARRPADFHSVSFAGKIADPTLAPDLRAQWDSSEAVLAASYVRAVVDRILGEAERYGPDGPWLGNVTHGWACNACEFRPECAWWHVPATDLLL